MGSMYVFSSPSSKWYCSGWNISKVFKTSPSRTLKFDEKKKSSLAGVIYYFSVILTPVLLRTAPSGAFFRLLARFGKFFWCSATSCLDSWIVRAVQPAIQALKGSWGWHCDEMGKQPFSRNLFLKRRKKLARKYCRNLISSMASGVSATSLSSRVGCSNNGLAAFSSLFTIEFVFIKLTVD